MEGDEGVTHLCPELASGREDCSLHFHAPGSLSSATSVILLVSWKQTHQPQMNNVLLFICFWAGNIIPGRRARRPVEAACRGGASCAWRSPCTGRSCRWRSGSACTRPSPRSCRRAISSTAPSGSPWTGLRWDGTHRPLLITAQTVMSICYVVGSFFVHMPPKRCLENYISLHIYLGWHLKTIFF